MSACSQDHMEWSATASTSSRAAAPLSSATPSVEDPFLVRAGRRPTVVGTGLVALDLVLSEASGAALQRWAGGTCGNVLAILSYLGWRAHPVARLNGDAAGEYVRSDLGQWGVHLDFAAAHPGPSTPIIAQRILRDGLGRTRHAFSRTCPACGAALPRYRSVLVSAARRIAQSVAALEPKVFFLDRVSRGALLLAEACGRRGAVVVFEPTSIGDPAHFAEALELAHIVKYAHDRIGELPELPTGNAALVEVQTLGARGLRFRTRLGKSREETGAWRLLPAFEVHELADAAGSGDWCTAGLLHVLCQDGLVGLRASAAEQVQEGLRFGQALAAWNCGFEGARGGMYQVSRRRFRAEVRAILAQGVVLPRRQPRPTLSPAADTDAVCSICGQQLGQVLQSVPSA